MCALFRFTSDHMVFTHYHRTTITIIITIIETKQKEILVLVILRVWSQINPHYFNQGRKTKLHDDS